MNPTTETYSELQEAYEFYNKTLFGGELPNCLITLQREKLTLGYFSSERFVNQEQTKIDEIAMNPAFFSVRSIELTLSTLVHEMVHLWQHHFGKVGRARYHNKQWGNKMIAVGLMPSNTGRPGGKKTGDQMDHYIIEDGLFAQHSKILISQSFKLSWADRYPPLDLAALEDIEKRLEELSKKIDEHDEDHCDTNTPAFVAIDDDPTPAGELARWGISVEDLPKPKKKTRSKFTCPRCGDAAWGKPTLQLACVPCNATLVEED